MPKMPKEKAVGVNSRQPLFLFFAQIYFLAKDEKFDFSYGLRKVK
jgi:hypothetical protein